MEHTELLDVKAIIFQLKDEEYAIPVQQVGSIEHIQHITRVPQTDEFVKGVINLRGVVTPIIDLRMRFGMDESVLTDSSRIIIVYLDSVEVGLIVDACYDVIDIPNESIEPPPEVIGTVDVDYIDGVAKMDSRLLMLLNMEKVLSDHEKNHLKQMEG